MSRDYDVLVIGSGFGGSVAALRLSEKGYRVGVLEKGARWAPEDHPPNSEHTRKVAWRPHFGMIGPLQLTALKNVLVQTFIAVGGGSLMYGGVLYEPPQTFYDNPQWASITDWRAELAAYYDQAKRMLGVATNPRLTPADEAFKAVAEDLGVADTFQPTDVGIFFGEPGKTVPDPYFGGAGPERAGCIFCSQCMTGCPHNAKNTTERNYLYLAEKAGAQIHPMTTVIDVRESPTGGYLVETVRSGRWFSKERRIWSADQVVFAAASIGTQELLHRLRAKGSLPGISPRLGELARTNSEATLIVSSRTRTDLSQGVVGTSSIRPDEHTHAEAFHLGKGSNSGFLLATTLIDGDKHRLARWIGTNLRHPAAFLRAFNVNRAAERSITILVMQDLDNSVTTYLRRGLFGRKLASRQGVGAPNQDWIPAANDVARRTAQKLDGDARGYYFDLIGRPTTAHFIGGCPIGDSPATGVVDPYQRLYGHPGLHVIDGSTITANLGVNPALTITAMSERAVALWPNNGEPDPRPAPGAGYRPVAPVPPRHPIVPVSAPASLRLTPV